MDYTDTGISDNGSVTLPAVSYTHLDVYKRQVSGSGKTVILAKVEEELRTNESRYINWLVFDVNPARDIPVSYTHLM